MFSAANVAIVNQSADNRADEATVALAREIVDHEMLFRKSM